MTLADNRVALVTGGSRGSTALALARGGADVIVTYRAQKRGALEVVHEIEAQDRTAAALPLDIGNVSTLLAFVSGLRDTLGELWRRKTFGLLVNNAGFGLVAPFAETTEEMFEIQEATRFLESNAQVGKIVVKV
jgi:NAD(P)-dependent dehydrogenase (short-subunit alcohol dehydrogenase family)